MARFFIHRPVFAWVLAFVTMLVGGLGLQSLAIEQYPQIAPTTIRISAGYNGASAEIVEDSVTAVIEDGMTGLDGLIYMTSNSTPGSASVLGCPLGHSIKFLYAKRLRHRLVN